MKKITAVLVCVLVLCSVMVFGASAEPKNFCETFEAEINTLHICINNQIDVSTSQNFEAESIMSYLDVKIGDEKYKEMGDKGFCLVDADIVEAKAKSYFLNVDIKALRKTINPFEDSLTGQGFAAHRYNKSAKKYVIKHMSIGLYSRYVVVGYKARGDKYDVYSAYISLMEENNVPKNAVLNKDYVIYDGEKFNIQYSVKTTVAYKNNTVQFCAWDYDVTIPNVKTLITPKTDLSDTSSDTSSATSSDTSSATSSDTSSATSSDTSSATSSDTSSDTSSATSSDTSSATSSVTSSATSSATPSQTSSSDKVNDTAIYAQAEDLDVTGKANLFPQNTVVKAEKVTDGEVFDRVKNSLPDDTGRYMVYEITAISNDKIVQPKGKINATFKVPSSFDIDRVAVLYISPESKVEKIDSKTDYVNGRVTAELCHFSTYVLAEVGDTLDTDGSAAKGSTAFVWIIIAVIAFAILAGAGVFVILYLNYRKASK